MKLLRPNYLRLYIAVFGFAAAASSLACMYHGDSGYLPWANHGLSSRAALPGSLPAVAKKKVALGPAIELKSVSMLRAKVDTQKDLVVSYKYPSQSEQPQIELAIDFGLGPGIALAENSVKLAGSEGEHTFNLMPLKGGSYRLRITARDLSSGDTVPGVKTVFVNIYE